MTRISKLLAWWGKRWLPMGALAGLIMLLDWAASKRVMMADFGFEGWPSGYVIQDGAGVRIVGVGARDGELVELGQIGIMGERHKPGLFCECVDLCRIELRAWPRPGVEPSRLPSMDELRRGFAPCVEKYQANGNWESVAADLRLPEGEWAWHLNPAGCIHDATLLWLLASPLIAVQSLLARRLGRAEVRGRVGAGSGAKKAA